MARKNKLGALMVLGVAVLLLFGTILPASAAPLAGAIIFRGVAQSADLCYPGAKTLNPNVAAKDACASDSPNNGAVRTWSLNIGNGTISAPLSSADFCVGADSTGAVGIIKYGFPGFSSEPGGVPCDLHGSGQVLPGPAYEGGGLHSPVKVGPYCGASHGNGSFTSRVKGNSVTEQVEWIQSAATVLPTFDGDPNNTKGDDQNGDGIADAPTKVLVAGVTDAIGATDGGDCGLTKESVGFNVIGVAIAIAQ